ncbi:ectoine/hydroxyectoine ABC transporter permease subunit EhuD [Candidatus Manganitrophus noduliformans]|uniref:Ectoine/hydroxyectoine ABC transporter permease subunit EhuD n=1 Tax=Candidatus Manganitrophus noduliformans TaxID=2606439 RepID=A0A7X6DL96_9BACT|nr:ectoine/hydroxyectoine ABC transporter permease subunit EhuD [Candidatus Manganitrophus noduliformans]NKE69255.1 ectoine/hydroxyectoine ABC transporter permease subunit EhuD [Candidatus Manganitrophus noduliformans]
MFDWEFAISILPALLKALRVTLQATLVGISIALLLGLVWAFLGHSGRGLPAKVTAASVEFIRSTPLLVQIYFLFYVAPNFGLTLSPFSAGTLALGLHYSAYTAEVYRAGIEGVPSGQWEAALSLNMGRFLTWRSVILPQAIPPVIPALGNYLVAMFKETPLLAAITVMELLQTAKIIGAQTFRYLEPLTLVGLLFLAVSLVASRLVRRLEVRFGSR